MTVESCFTAAGTGTDNYRARAGSVERFEHSL